ncbi:uncharacterized protein LOC113797565 [Dermatophagoides pteronyssinus]|uniref:uncharacterized protein LOC113797565 n=1 Tax=Dermatophagoides pteronyssinus TaxID=6956 RepID=UPI003F6693F3
MPTFLGCFTFMSLMKISKQLINNINKNLNIYRSIIVRLKSRKKFPRTKHRVEIHLIKSFSLYTRLIVLTEDIQKYVSKLILLALITGFISSQFTIYSLKCMTNGHWSMMLMFYYMLAVELFVILLLMYIISKFNQQINLIRPSLEQTIQITNKVHQMNRFKFNLMNFYHRIVSNIPWGMRIGPTIVLTKFVFFKIIIFYARFTMLSSKFF